MEIWPQLQVSTDRLKKLWIEPATPEWFIHYTTVTSFLRGVKYRAGSERHAVTPGRQDLKCFLIRTSYAHTLTVGGQLHKNGLINGEMFFLKAIF